MTPRRSGTDLAILRALAAKRTGGSSGYSITPELPQNPNNPIQLIYSVDREPSIEGRRALYHGPLLQGELQEPPMGLGEVPDAPEDRPMGVASGVPIGRMLIGRDDVSGR